MKLDKKKIIVTGGAGFIGSALIRNLVKNKNFNILNIDDLKYSGQLFNMQSFKNCSNYSFIKADITDEELMSSTIKKFKPNIIFNLAAESHVDRSIQSPNPFIYSNIIGTYSLLCAANEYYKKIAREDPHNFKFIHISTDEVFGDTIHITHKVDESCKYYPSSPYSASKAASDHLVYSWNRTYGLPTIITNCTNNYGPFQHNEKFIPSVITSALKNKPIKIYGNGNQIRDWLHVDDHVNALILIMNSDIVGETYNISAGIEIKNIDLAHKICDMLQKLSLKNSDIKTKNFRDLITFVDDRLGHDRKYSLDSSKMRNDFGWSPNNSFDDSLLKTIMWYKEFTSR